MAARQKAIALEPTVSFIQVPIANPGSESGSPKATTWPQKKSMALFFGGIYALMDFFLGGFLL